MARNFDHTSIIIKSKRILGMMFKSKRITCMKFIPKHEINPQIEINPRIAVVLEQKFELRCYRAIVVLNNRIRNGKTYRTHREIVSKKPLIETGSRCSKSPQQCLFCELCDGQMTQKILFK